MDRDSLNSGLLLLVWIILTPPGGQSAEPLSRAGGGRIIFVGDSITGQGGGWQNAGFVFQMRDALGATDPDPTPELVPLGGSGMGVGAWLGLLNQPDKQSRYLDVKGVEVGTSLSKPADVLVVMLGMNDLLAPYVQDSDESLDQWKADYRKVLDALEKRLHPKITALATITPQTEDPGTPKNQVEARMNERIRALANERKALLLPTHATYWEVLKEARQRQSTFTLAGDRIHPNQAGHIAVAMAMLKGLGEDPAAAWLREARWKPILDGLTPVAAPPQPPPWLVTSGLILKGWQEAPATEDLVPNPIDLAIQRGEDFTQAPSHEGGSPLSWRPFQSGIHLTDGTNPDSVDFAGITFGRNFEAGYGARWIRCETSQPVKLAMKASGVGSVSHLTVWLNGVAVYTGMLTSEPKRQATRDTMLRAGWNVLVFKSCHRTWQWQQSISVTRPDGTPPAELEIRGEPPP